MSILFDIVVVGVILFVVLAVMFLAGIGVATAVAWFGDPHRHSPPVDLDDEDRPR